MLKPTAIITLQTKIRTLYVALWIDAHLFSFFVIDTCHMFHYFGYYKYFA